MSLEKYDVRVTPIRHHSVEIVAKERISKLVDVCGRFDFEEDEMLLRPPPFRQVTEIDAARLEDDCVAVVQQTSIGCRQTPAIVSAVSEWFPSEPGISKINFIVVFRPI